MLTQHAPHTHALGQTSQLTRVVASPCPVVITSSINEQTFTLTNGRCVVGSSAEVDYVLQEKTVSRRHLSLELVPEGVRVVDLESTNGTSYCGRTVSDMVLSTDGELRLGRATIRVAFALKTGADLDVRSSYGALHVGPSAVSSMNEQLAHLEGSLLGVLLSGQPGAELERVARFIHQHSKVSLGPWVTVNCAALNHDALSRELFGNRGGALTATEGRVGAFGRADGGTLFLDEVAELPLDVQAMLQRALHERDVCAQRGNLGERSSARVIAGTRHDLEELVRRGRFRQDLYRRLSVVGLRLPTDPRPAPTPRRLAVTLPLGVMHGVGRGS